MFIIILIAVIISGIVAAISLPNLAPNLTSKFSSLLPNLNMSNWFSNPKIKIPLRDREYFSENKLKLLKNGLFIVLGQENYKLYNLLSPKDKQGIPKKLEISEEAFELLQIEKTHFLFINPSVMHVERERFYNTRLRLLINRICKLRKQAYIDGVIVVPDASIYNKGDNLPSKELLEEINIFKFVFQKFDKYFKVNIPIFIYGNNSSSTKTIFRNTFKTKDKSDKYFGFSCNVANRNPHESIAKYYEKSAKQFLEIFHAQTQKILYESREYTNGLQCISVIHRVEEEIFQITNKYLSYFFEDFEKTSSYELASISILNSILFSSQEGSNSEDSIKNLLYYLATERTDKLIFSEKFLNRRRRKNFWFGAWTVIFACVGAAVILGMYEYLQIKKAAYVANSISKYDQFATLFNSNLSNQYPFAPFTVSTNASLANWNTVAAEYAKITSGNQGYFYQHISDLTNRDDIQVFVNQFNLIQSILAPSKDTKGTVTGPFNLGIKFKFRDPKTDERLANRIIDWSIGTGRYTDGSAFGDYWQAIFPWTYGDSIVFNLQFPKESDASYADDLTPQTTFKSGSRFQLTDNSATIAFQGDPWSFFRMIETYSQCEQEEDNESDCDRGILRFSIPLKNGSYIVFFCTVEVYNQDNEKLSIPNFPIVAPSFNS